MHTGPIHCYHNAHDGLEAKRALQKGAKGTLLLVRENEEGRVSINLEQDGTPIYINTAQSDPTMVPETSSTPSLQSTRMCLHNLQSCHQTGVWVM